eukprot:2434330-Rhodomonas_salina.1
MFVPTARFAAAISGCRSEGVQAVSRAIPAWFQLSPRSTLIGSGPRKEPAPGVACLEELGST